MATMMLLKSKLDHETINLIAAAPVQNNHEKQDLQDSPVMECDSRT